MVLERKYSEQQLAEEIEEYRRQNHAHTERLPYQNQFGNYSYPLALSTAPQRAYLKYSDLLPRLFQFPCQSTQLIAEKYFPSANACYLEA